MEVRVPSWSWLRLLPTGTIKVRFRLILLREGGAPAAEHPEIEVVAGQTGPGGVGDVQPIQRHGPGAGRQRNLHLLSSAQASAGDDSARLIQDLQLAGPSAECRSRLEVEAQFRSGALENAGADPHVVVDPAEGLAVLVRQG